MVLTVIFAMMVMAGARMPISVIFAMMVMAAAGVIHFSSMSFFVCENAPASSRAK